jgi:hypothetical protein
MGIGGEMDYEIHIRSAWERVSERDLEEGDAWYPNAHWEAEILAEATWYPLNQVCKVIAALSPACPWERNIQDARNVLVNEDAAVVCTYGGNKKIALEVLREDVELKGRKTSTFAKAIEYPDAGHVVIDRHMISVALGYRADDKERNKYGRQGKAQEEIVAAFTKVAEEVGVNPTVLQATLWVWYRRGGQEDSRG